MTTRLFIGRMQQYDDDGKPERQHLYAALEDDPDSPSPCSVPFAATHLVDLIEYIDLHSFAKHRRPTFEPPRVVECPGRSGFVPRLYTALTLDEIEWVRQRLRM